MTNIQQKKTDFGKALYRKRKKMRKAKNQFVSSGLSITLMTSIEGNKTNYTFESALKYAEALGFEIIIKEKGNGND